MNKKFVPILLAGALLLLMAAVPSLVKADHSWGNYHWARASNPVGLDVGDNVDSTWDGHLDVAVSDWNRSSVLDLAVAAGMAKGKCRPTEGRIEVCNDFYGNNGWLGVAQIWVSGDHITQATTKVNDTYFSSPPYNTDTWRQLVMCQELGHDFGLAHQNEDFGTDETNSCMEYTSEPQGNEHPDNHDYQQLEDIYAHLDGGSGDDGGDDGGDNCPPNGNGNKPGCGGNNGVFGPGSGELHSQKEWGQLVREQGRTAVYVRDFGGGNRVVTFVIWAD